MRELAVQFGSRRILCRWLLSGAYSGIVIASGGILWQNTLSPPGGNPDGHFNAPVWNCHDCGCGWRHHPLQLAAGPQSAAGTSEGQESAARDREPGAGALYRQRGRRVAGRGIEAFAGLEEHVRLIRVEPDGPGSAEV